MKFQVDLVFDLGAGEEMRCTQNVVAVDYPDGLQHAIKEAQDRFNLAVLPTWVHIHLKEK